MVGAQEKADFDSIEPPWRLALDLAWEGLGAGAVPVGAVVLDGSGNMVTNGRGRSFETSAPPGQLCGSRIAHAEINALAQLEGDGFYEDHELLTTVEPCPLCMGAALMTGLGTVVYAFEDPYGGGRTMTIDNVRSARTTMRVEQGPHRMVRMLSALMVFLHYRQLRPIPVVQEPLEATVPDVAAIAGGPLGAKIMKSAQELMPLSDAVELFVSATAESG